MLLQNDCYRLWQEEDFDSKCRGCFILWSYLSSFVSSDRSSCSDDGLLYIYLPGHFFQIFTQSIDAIDVTSVTLSRLNSVNAIDVTRCKLRLRVVFKI